ncbi:MAG: hemolysin-type calcium-binding [Desulfobulbaceae bacterium]|nr:MAG: hemolysin-type calcium-binding [Desulfobulbaceae bacterium]
MENETVKHEDLLRIAIDQGLVEQAVVAPDGTITVPRSKGKLLSVDVADVDLVLGFEDGTFIIIPYGALDAISEAPPKVHFLDAQDSLAVLFKMVGIINPAKAGSLRVVTDNVDAANLPAEEREEMAQDELPVPDLPAPPAPLARVSAGTTPGGKGPGKGAGLGGSGEGDGEVQATVTPLAVPQPAVYRVGTKQQISIEDLLNGLGLGEQPNLTQTLYTSSAFKLAPSGRADLPLGSYDGSLSSTQLAQHASPEGQSTREVINGSASSDTIDHNAVFSSGVAQWSKTMHLTFNNFSEVSAIQIVVSAAKLALIPGFDIQGAGVSRTAPNSNTWMVTPSADIFGYGQDIQIVYNVTDSTVAPVDFGADITVTGKTGPLNFEITNNIVFTWRDATTESEFTVPSDSGDLMMVLPRAGLGVEILAGAGDDTVSAGAGHDLLHGEVGDDTLYGGTGNDILDGGAGADALDGGQGFDTATYVNATLGVAAVLDLATGIANTNEANGDTYVNIENLTGSSHNDILIGDAAVNILTGLAGDDVLSGRGGSDTIDGGDGTDTASYEFATSAVTVNLTSNTGTQGEADGDILISIENLIGGSGNDTFTGAHGIQANAFDGRGGTSDTVSYTVSTEGLVVALDHTLLLTPVTQTNDAAGDTFVNIENLIGTAYADTLIGNNVANVLTGGAGNDILEGLGSGDAFIGGAGTDTISYANSVLGVVSSLTTTFGSGPAVTQTNDALGDTYVGIENMIGSGGSDTLIGESNNNRIEGGAGDDTLEGMGGADQLIGGVGIDTASYVHSTYVYASLTTLAGFTNVGDAAGDTYDGIENLTGSSFNDILIGTAGSNVLTGGDGDDVLEGMEGADVLDGGAGVNTASYEHSSDQGAGTGVTASLITPGVSNTGDAAGDTYINILNLTGSAFNDTLTGDANNNVIYGGAGNDTITGGAGTDALSGDAGNDSISDDLVGAARLYGGTGDDQITITSYDNIAGMQDLIDGGSGTDTLIWAGAGSRLDFNMWNGTFSNSTFSGIENITISGTNSSYIYLDNYDNVIIGGSNIDYVDYRYALAGISVNLLTGVVTGGSGNDTLSNIDYIYGGSAFDDVLIGNNSNNWIRGYYGADTIDGLGGSDTWYLDWSGWSTTASLLTAAQNAAMGIVMIGDAAGDSVTNMENIYASYGDSIYGNAGANTLYGRGLIEGFLGSDFINGAGTVATASYANAGNSYLAGLGITAGTGVGVIANLTTAAFANGGAVNNSGDAAGDTYSASISNITGSAFADILVGNASANALSGGAGDDILEGLAGSDVLRGGAGNDTVSYAHANAAVLVDIDNNTARTLTNDAAGDTFFEIENITGSNFNDFLYGDEHDNVLIGGLGNDNLDGGNGTDTASYASATGSVVINLATNTVSGSAGNDTLVSIERIIGSAYVDTITGTAGDDVLDGGEGSDSIDGSAGNDTISYASATSFRNVNLLTGTNSDNDALTSIENIIGTRLNDTLTGDNGDNIIEGGLGNDVLIGGVGTDTVSYANAPAGVTVSLAIATAQTTGGAGSDTLSGFENLLGSAYNDILTGDGSANIITGGSGDDMLIGGAGADSLNGGLGTDTVSYATSGAGVTITINGGAGVGGDAAGDLLTGIENLVGSNFGDTLTGDGGANLFIAGNGNDTLNGLGGMDTVSYVNATAFITAYLPDGTVTGGSGSDSVSNIENIIGSIFADSLTGNDSDNIIEGGAGADTLIGGAGNDTASYVGSDAGVNVSLVSGATNTGGHAAGDSLLGFENLLGSAFNDTLTGDLNSNMLDGGAGDDILIGGVGADALIGGIGTNTASYLNATSAVTASLTTGTGTLGEASGDTYSSIQNLTGSAYNDNLTGDGYANKLDGGAGNDTLTGNAGDDIFDVRLGRDTAHGGDGDDLFLVDAGNVANLPNQINGNNSDYNSTRITGTGDTVELFNLGGSYSMTSLANATNSMEILDIRDAASTTLSISSLDVRNFVDGGNASQIWIKADSGDHINVTLSGTDTSMQTITVSPFATDYVVFSGTTQTAQIHWQTA